MRPQPALVRTTFRTPAALAAPAFQRTVQRRCCPAAAPLRLPLWPAVAPTACGFSTAARPRQATAAAKKQMTATATATAAGARRLFSSSEPSLSSSAAPARDEAPAPVLPLSTLAEVLFPTAGAGSKALSGSTLASAPAAATAVALTNTNTHPTVYATVYIHGRPYLVTPGDSLRLPFRMPGVRAGDELRLDRVGVVGSRAVTAVSAAVAGVRHGNGSAEVVVPQVPGASVRAVVLGVETEPLRVMVKTKRRNRRKRTVKSKHQFTVLRIQEVVVEAAAGEEEGEE